MPISFLGRISIPQDILMREIEQETVILSLKNDYYYGLNQTGTRMLAVLTSSITIEDAFQNLLAEYEIDEPTLRKDLELFIEQLLKQDLVSYSE